MNLLKKLALGAIVAGFVGVAAPAEAQIYVKVRPSHPSARANARPPRPAGAVWIEDDWRANGSRYDYAGGRWETPPRRGMTWRAGQWRNTPRRGYVWVPGRWVAARHF